MIYTVTYGDSLNSIAARFSVSRERIISDNGLIAPYTLSIGQALLILIPLETYEVKSGDTLESLSEEFGMSKNHILQRNPTVSGKPLAAGDILVLSFRGNDINYNIFVSGYAYTFVDRERLDISLPYCSAVIPFTYGFDRSGNLLTLDDQTITEAASQFNIDSLMHLSTLTDGNRFDNTLSDVLFENPELEDRLISQIIQTIESRGYSGIDVDFEYIGGENAEKYADFIRKLHSALQADGYLLIVALAPKYNSLMSGTLYEGHDYELLGSVADYLLIMTYEWGYEYSEPQAVAPIENVRRVVDYAASVMDSRKILLGIPNYGYNWTLPFVPGKSRAKSLSNTQAAFIAAKYGAEIRYSVEDATPYFNYTDEEGNEHEVWFEDPRSISEKLKLIRDYSLGGCGIWNLMRDFPALFLQIATGFNIKQP